jgi:exonuclease VII large subunit
MAETATDVREQTQEKAQEVAAKATDQARTQIDQRSTELGERARSMADDIRTVGEQLREQGKDQPAKVADKAAQPVERLANWLRDSDSDRMLSDIEDFGRKQPWAFALGGLVLGIAASRFLKASSTKRYRQREEIQSFGSPGYGNGQSHPDARARIGVPATPPPPSAHIPGA